LVNQGLDQEGPDQEAAPYSAQEDSAQAGLAPLDPSFFMHILLKNHLIKA